MSQSLGKLLVHLITIAGLDPNADELKDLVISDLQVPDDIALGLKTNLLTNESAKNNPELKNYFHAQALNMIDTNLEEWMEGYHLDDSAKTELKSQKSSYKRMRSLLDKVRELEAAKAQGAADPATIEKMQKYRDDIRDLNAKLSDLPAQHANSLRLEQEQATSRILEAFINAELNGREYANDKVDKTINLLTARNLLDRGLAEAKAKAILSPTGSIKLVQADDPTMDFMRENKIVNFGSFTDTLLGESKMLKVSDGGSSSGTKTPLKHIPIDPTNAGAIPQEAAAFYEKQLASMS